MLERHLRDAGFAGWHGHHGARRCPQDLLSDGTKDETFEPARAVRPQDDEICRQLRRARDNSTCGRTGSCDELNTHAGSVHRPELVLHPFLDGWFGVLRLPASNWEALGSRDVKHRQ